MYLEDILRKILPAWGEHSWRPTFRKWDVFPCVASDNAVCGMERQPKENCDQSRRKPSIAIHLSHQVDVIFANFRNSIGEPIAVRRPEKTLTFLAADRHRNSASTCTPHDRTNSAGFEVEYPGNSALREKPRVEHLTNEVNLIVRYERGGNIWSSLYRPSFFNHVAAVLSSTPKAQVRRVAARRVVARVENAILSRVNPSGEKKRNPMGQEYFTGLYSELSVPVTQERSPYPALAGVTNRYLLPESLYLATAHCGDWSKLVCSHLISLLDRWLELRVIYEIPRSFAYFTTGVAS